MELIVLNELLNYEQPTKYLVETINYSDEYETPVLTAGKTFVLGYTNENEGIYLASKENPVIIFDDFTTAFHWVDFPFKVKSSAMKLLQPISPEINLRYIYYAMLNIRYIPKSHKRQWISTYSNFKIPVPPVEIQNKIIQLLDESQSLIDNRKQQIDLLDELSESLFYETFGDIAINSKNLLEKKFKDICKVSQGLQIPISKRKEKNGENRYKYITVQYLNGKKKTEYIENPKSTVICNKNDILMARTGNTGMVITDVEGVFHNNFFKIDFNRNLFSKEYLIYYLNNRYIQADIKRRAGTSTIPDLNHGDFYDLKILIPAIDLQNEFAEKVEAIEKQKELLEKSLKLMEDNYNALMQRAFKGELF